MGTTGYRRGSWGQAEKIAPLLQFNINPASIGCSSNFQLDFNLVGYVVTPGKTLYLVKLQYNNIYFFDSYLKFGYCDNDCGQFPSNSNAVNPVMSVGLADFNPDNGVRMHAPFAPDVAGNAARNLEIDDLFLKVAIGGKFPFMYGNSGLSPKGTLMAWGIEL
jgi:hypothetical protein